MTASRTLILLTLLVIAQTGQAQMLRPTSAEQLVSVHSSVASQTNSPNNYALLQPIGTEPALAVPPKPATGNQLQSGLLSPIPVKTSSGAVPQKAVMGSALKVTPVSFKRGEFDRHQFKLENVGGATLRAAQVLLKAPAGSLIQQVIPKPDSVDGSNVIVSVEELPVGAHTLVEIMIENPSNEFSRFDSIVLTGNGAQQSVTTSATDNSHSQGGIIQLLEPRSSAAGMLKPKIQAQQASVSRPVQEKEVVKKTSSTTPVKANANEPLPSNTYRSEGYPAESKSDVSRDQYSSTVKAWINGPSQISVGEESEFSIEVENSSSEIAEGVIVQLTIPENMKVTVLDRAAWYDSDSRKISWELASLGKGVPETIRYKAVFKSAGSVDQSIVVGLNQTVQCTASLPITAN